jgi:L-threonylcarbamoyladenylate synthase
MIVLIADVSEVSRFGIRLSLRQKRFLLDVWPGKVSVVLPLSGRNLSRFEYLHRKTGTIAFRVPKLKWLRELLKTTGPLVAPSANFEGEPPALTVRDAKRYFGKSVDYYFDVGRRVGKPSKIIKLDGNDVIVLRK